MRLSSLKMIVLAVISLAIASCNTTKKTVQVASPVKVKTPSLTNAAVHKILYGEWIVYKVGTQIVSGNDRPYIIFDGSDNPESTNMVKTYANDGCNIINGVYEITPGGKMERASEFISTMRLCPDAPYEMGMSLAMNEVKKFDLDKIGNDYLLSMKNASDSVLMVLRRYDLNFINGAWSVTSVNGDAVPADAGIKLVIDTPEQKIHGNVGCNTMNGSIVINPDRQNSMRFTDIATTRMTCPQIALEQKILQALSKVATVTPLDNKAGAQLKDEAGNVLITLKRINLR